MTRLTTAEDELLAELLDELRVIVVEEAAVDEVEEEDVEVLVALLEVVDVVEVLVDVVEVVVGAALEVVVWTDEVVVLSSESEEPSRLYTTMLACPPLGTVTTQKSEPPAPVAFRSLVTPLPSTAQGRPTQLPDVHSILSPKVGLVP